MEVASGAFEDLVGNDFAGISGATSWNFTTGDFTAPTVSSLLPLDNATSVALNPNLVITFNENVRKGTGNIVLKRSSDNSVVETIPVASSLVDVSGVTATVNLATTLAETTGYYLEIASGAFEDVAGNDFAGISGATSWNFTTGDFTPPATVSLLPVDGATRMAPDTHLVITFNENVEKGTGNILLKKSIDNGAVETIPVTSTRVEVSGVTATINLTASLTGSTGYYVEVPTGAFEDLVGNDFAGISGPTSWNFTTNDPPVVSSVTPELSGALPPLSTFDLTFNKPIAPASFSGPELALLDLSDLDPSWLGSSDGVFYDCVIQGSLLYAATVTGLHVFDVSNPAAVTRLGSYHTPGAARGVQVVDSRAYVADGGAGLEILDVSNPAAVTRLGGYDTPGSARAVQVVGNRAYVADCDAGLQILDVSNPAAVTRLGGYDPLGYAYAVQVVGNRAYVAGCTTALKILDVSNPAAVKFLGGYGMSGDCAWDVQVTGTVAYLANCFAGLHVLDVSNPASVKRLDIYNTSGIASGVQVVGNRAYVADDSAGVEILDVSSPAAVTRLGGYDTSGAAHGVQVVGSMAYVADGSSLEILEVSNPAAVTRLGGYETSGWACSVQVVGNRAYVASYAAGLQILDVSNPAAVSRLGGYQTSGYAKDVQVVGSLAYVAVESAGLEILDVSNPAAVTRLGGYDTPGNARAVQVVGSRAYVADVGAGLAILDVSNPAAVKYLRQYDTPGYAYGVHVVGSRAYIADTGTGLEILDVSNPAAVTRLGGYDTPGNAWNVQVVGTLAYVADDSAGIHILDVSDPAAVTRLGGYDTSGYAWGVQVVGSVAYVADLSKGLEILDVSNPAAVTRLAAYSTPDSASGVHVLGSRVYVADFDAGLQILEVGSPAASVSYVSGNTYRVDLGRSLPEGEYVLLLGPEIVDSDGWAMDQDHDGTPREASEDVYFARFTVAYTDSGDAPDPTYPTLLASNGARHTIVTGMHLGSWVDGEAHGRPSADANGDDNSGTPDDEDGVVFTSLLVPGEQATIEVTASAPGKLDAWIDFDADGSWAQTGDQIFGGQALVAGVNSLSFPVPAGASAALQAGSGRTFARFRISSAGGLTFTGPAPDGEVEDYQVVVQPPVFQGTAGPDAFTFSTNGTAHTVTGPGVTRTFDASIISAIRFDGLAGNDQITVTGGSGDETALLGKHHGEVVGPGYRVVFTDTEKIRVLAGAGTTQTAYLDDAPGENDKFYALFYTVPKISYMLYADGSECRVYGFSKAEGRATLGDGDLDVAYMYDSAGNETYTGSEGSSSMVLPNVYENVAAGFERVYAYSTAAGAGQCDTAAINDSPGNDRFYASPSDGYVWYASGGLNFANGFNKVECHATGGSDIAILNDAPGNDTLEARIDRSMMTPTGGGSYENWACGFDSVYAYGTAGGVDTGIFHDGPGNDRFVAGCGAPNDSYLSYQTGQVAWGRGFELVEGTASGGMDQAWLYDSPANDVYTVMNGTNEATMLPQSDTAYSRKAIGFDKYYAYATNGGTDEAHLYDSAGNDVLQAGNLARTKSPLETTLTYNTGPLAGMLLWTYAFEKLTAHATMASGDTDTAYFYDEPTQSETFTADQTLARFKRNTPGWDINALGFDLVYAFGTSAPGAAVLDIAEITDSALNDVVRTYGASNESYIRFGGMSSNQTYAKGFDSVKFKFLNGASGTELVDMSGTAGDETFRGDLDWAEMVDDLATYFFRIEGLSGGQTPSVGDSLIIRGSTGTNRDLSQTTRDYVLTRIGTWV